MIFDTHSHYEDSAFDKDREEVLDSLHAAGVERIVDIGSTIESLDQCIAIAKSRPFAWCALGIHPGECEPMTEEVLESLRQKLRDPENRAVAVGEIGLDYHWPEPARELQQHWFLRQLELAAQEKLPVVIHSRDAAKDTLDVMEDACAWENGGVIHCFSYSVEMARIYRKKGFFIGVGGVITFKNARKLREVVLDTPLESIVLETDCPYMAPTPHRGERNYSGYLPLVVNRIAQLKEVDPAEVERVTWDNACRLYRLK